MAEPAVFIDRDDTINPDVPYCSDPADFELMPGAAEGIERLNEAGLTVIVVTNQSGIARGYFDEATLEAIHDKMHRLLAEEGASVEDVYHCPHHPDDGCECRKPGTAMLEQAARDHGIDLSASAMVGDRVMDVVAAHRVGALGVIIPSEKGQKELETMDVEPDHVAEDLVDAADWLVKRLAA